MRSRLPAFAAATLGLLVGAAPALAEIGPWVAGGQARARLVATRINGGRDVAAAVEVALPDGWKTYWRSPGYAGMAPSLDFSRSTNLADAEVAFPVPERFDDGYGTSNVYKGGVVLPVAVATGDPARPLELRLSLDIGVCDRICVPEHFDLALTLDSLATDSEAARLIAEARERLPQPAEPGVFDVERIVRSGGSEERPQYDVSIRAPEPDDVLVFVEGPPGWHAGPAERVEGEESTYRVGFDRAGSALDGATFRITLVAGDRAVEQTVALDGGG